MYDKEIILWRDLKFYEYLLLRASSFVVLLLCSLQFLTRYWT